MEHAGDLVLQIEPAAGGDAGEVAELTQRLRAPLLDLDVDSVDPIADTSDLNDPRYQGGYIIARSTGGNYLLCYDDHDRTLTHADPKRKPWFVIAKSPFNDVRGGFEGSLTINRNDYGIKTYPGVIGEDVEISLGIEAVKQEVK